MEAAHSRSRQRSRTVSEMENENRIYPACQPLLLLAASPLLEAMRYRMRMKKREDAVLAALSRSSSGSKMRTVLPGGRHLHLDRHEPDHPHSVLEDLAHALVESQFGEHPGRDLPE